MVVPTFGKHDDSDDGEEDDRNPFANEDDDRRETDGPVGEYHRQSEAGNGEPHPSDVHAPGGEQRLSYVRRAGIDTAGKGYVDKQQNPGRHESVCRAECGAIERVDGAG